MLAATQITEPPFKTKLFFWLILGAMSTFFAEVVAGSDMFPFFHPWGILVEVPLYTLHILVLSHLVFRLGKPTLNVLFLAGALFGMYEAYITKVMWQPPWGAMIQVGGVAVTEVVLLALFWHAWLAFITPLVLAEAVLTSSRETLNGLPARLRHLTARFRWLVLLIALGGLVQSGNSPSVIHSLGSGVMTTAVLLGLIYFWRRRPERVGSSLRQLLPNRREFRWLAGLTALMYLVFGITLRPESLPGLTGHFIIWLIYAGLIALFVIHLRRSRQTALAAGASLPVRFSWKKSLLLAGIFTAASMAGEIFLAGAGDGITGGLWLGGSAVGLAMLFRTIKEILKAPADGRTILVGNEP